MSMYIVLSNLAGYIGLSDYIPQEIPPLAGSLLFYAINIIVCGVLLRLNAAFVHKKYQIYLGTFLCTVQVCAGSLENGNILKLFGLPGLFAAVFLSAVLYRAILPSFSVNPVSSFHRVILRSKDSKQAAALILIQAVAGLAAYEYARVIWYLEIHEYHRVKHAQFICYSGLTVSVLTGAAIEACATISDVWLGWQRFTRFHRSEYAMKSAFGGFLITLGVHKTGMFYNPSIASCHFLGCNGTAVWQHMVVYWLAPFVGVIIASGINKYVRVSKLIDAVKPAAKKVSKKGKAKKENVSDKKNLPTQNGIKKGSKGVPVDGVNKTQNTGKSVAVKNDKNKAKPDSEVKKGGAKVTKNNPEVANSKVIKEVAGSKGKKDATMNQPVKVEKAKNKQNNAVKQQNNVVKQQTNAVKQHTNAVKQQTNTVKQQTNAVKQQTNAVKQQNNAVKQQNNAVKQQTNAVKQQTNAVKQQNNAVKQQNNAVKQQNVPAAATNKREKGKATGGEQKGSKSAENKKK